METIADLIREKMDLTIMCAQCKRPVACPYWNIPIEIPRNLPVTLAGARLVCLECKGRRIITGRQPSNYWKYVQ